MVLPIAEANIGSPQMSASGVKRTCRFALHMSAFDPKRTSSFDVTNGTAGPSLGLFPGSGAVLDHCSGQS